MHLSSLGLTGTSCFHIILCLAGRMVFILNWQVRVYHKKPPESSTVGGVFPDEETSYMAF